MVVLLMDDWLLAYRGLHDLLDNKMQLISPSAKRQQGIPSTIHFITTY